MSLPNMNGWKQENIDKALESLKERDRLFGWNKEDNDLAIVGKNGYDEEDLSRDSQGL